MQAMHGSAVRSRTRLFGCTMAIVLALSALAFASTASAKGGAPIKERYLALGDSLAFGFSQQLANENEKTGEAPTGFEHGYANLYFNHLKPKLNGVELVNNGCPGETSKGLIGTGPLGVGLSKAGAKTGPSCEYHTVKGLPLHHEYGAGKSQLESALEVIGIAAAEGKPVTTVTLNIGANDELQAVAQCEAEAKPTAEAAFIQAFFVEKKTKAEAEAAAHAAGKKFVEKCLTEAAPALFEQIVTNTGLSMYALRKGAEFGSVNYAGKIVLLGGYDPFGAVFVKGEELLPQSNGLTNILNNLESQPNAKNEPSISEKFGACFANPHPKFNPENKFEPARLQAYTNMANTSEFEGKKNGPDIHPTPTGYKVISSVMAKTCP